MNYQKTGTAFIELLQSNPIYRMQEDIAGWWIDQSINNFLKLYYWPFFVAGNLDNWKELFVPRTICKG